MLNRIIDAIIAGEQSDGQIAKWVQPSLSRTSIQNYRKSVVEPSLKQADVLKSVLPSNREENKPLTSCQAAYEQPDRLVKSALLAAPILAVRENRLAAKQDRIDRLNKVMAARAESYKDAAPGGETGLLTKKVKQFGEEYVIDEALLGQLSAHEKDMAIELGQWQESNQINVGIQIVYPGAERAGSAAEPDFIDISSGPE